MTVPANIHHRDLPELAGFCAAVGSDTPSGEEQCSLAALVMQMPTQSYVGTNMFEKLFLGAVSTLVAVVLLSALLQIADALIP